MIPRLPAFSAWAQAWCLTGGGVCAGCMRFSPPMDTEADCPCLTLRSCWDRGREVQLPLAPVPFLPSGSEDEAHTVQSRSLTPRVG
jgi:hypothetical protein